MSTCSDVPEPVLGSTAKAALRLPVEGTKRRKVLVVIAGYLDAGLNDPGVGLIAKHAKMPRGAVCQCIDMLEADGLLEVERGEVRRHERNGYRLVAR